jgi:hypothetical protein
VQTLRDVIENKLQRMIRNNPLRANLQQRYESIVIEYNKEKDWASIEKTFEELLRFVQELNEEQERAMREGLDEDALAIYYVSIRTPAWGATSDPPSITAAETSFNPHPRMGGDQRAWYIFSRNTKFQSAPPHGGRRPGTRSPSSPGSSFNPHPRMGGDRRP